MLRASQCPHVLASHISCKSAEKLRKRIQTCSGATARAAGCPDLGRANRLSSISHCTNPATASGTHFLRATFQGRLFQSGHSWTLPLFSASNAQTGTAHAVRGLSAHDKKAPDGAFCGIAACRQRITDYISLGVLTKTFPLDKVNSCGCRRWEDQPAATGLAAHVVVYYVIALTLYMQVSYREVLALACWKESKWLLGPGVGSEGGPASRRFLRRAPDWGGNRCSNSMTRWSPRSP